MAVYRTGLEIAASDARVWAVLTDFASYRDWNPSLPSISGELRESIASMLRENLDPGTTVIGLDAKVLAGAVFAELVADEALAADIRGLADRNGVTEARIGEAVAFARGGEEIAHADARLRAVLALARAGAPSPAEIDADVVAACREGELSAPAIVELVSWLSVLQMLHRLSCFYGAA